MAAGYGAGQGANICDHCQSSSGQDFSVGLLAQILKNKERSAARSGFQFRYLMQQSAHKIDIKPSFNNQKSIINFELS
jgi:hypothetical protein